MKELERRRLSDNYSEIKRAAEKNKLKLAAQLIDDGYEESMPYIELGFLDKKGEFKDFYYDSGLEYEEFQQYIPERFCEVMESSYEYHSGKKQTREQYIKEVFEILSKCGYKRLPDWKD